MTTWTELDRRAPIVEEAVAVRAPSPPARPSSSRPSSTAPTFGFLARTICAHVDLEVGPVTAFEIARLVLRHHPNRWASGSICRKVSKLADRRVLNAVDCDGISPDGAPCYRYRLGELGR